MDMPGMRSFLILLFTLIAPGICPVRAAPAASEQHFLYVASETDQTLISYRIAGATGALSELPGERTKIDPNPYSLAIDGSGTRLLAAHGDASTLLVFGRDHQTGAIAHERIAELTPGDYAVSVAVHPQRPYAYVTAMVGEAVVGYVLVKSGKLEPVPGSPYDIAGRPSAIAIHPSGNYLYVSNLVNANVSGFSVDRATGKLVQLAGSPFRTGTNPRAIGIVPDGRYAYVANAASADVSQFRIAHGKLLPLAPATVATGPNPRALVVDPSGKFAYVASYDSGQIWAYPITPRSGALTPLPGTPVMAGQGPRSMAIAAAGKFLCVANYASGDISVFRMDPDTGELTEVPGSPFASAKHLNGMAAF